mmetsp:Transcript_10609/g.36000  ORF Transcript_10609/g.36000 Transcript_10609/m.36000 type:complete len:452 (-) Transcript_10609:1834-3189(-)
MQAPPAPRSGALLDGELHREFLVGRLDGRPGAHHSGGRLLAEGLEALPQGLEVLGARGQHLLAERLPVPRCLPHEVLLQGGKALGVGLHGAVQVPDGPDHRLRHNLLGDRQPLEVLRRPVVVVHGLLEVGVTVAQVREETRLGAQAAEAAVGAAHDADRVPEVARAQVAGHHARRAGHLLPWLVERAAAAHVVHLGGHGNPLVHGHRLEGRVAPRAPRRHRAAGPRERRGEGLGVRHGLAQRLLVGGEVDHHALLGDELGAELLEARAEGGPVLLRLLEERLGVLEGREARGLLRHVGRRRVARADPRVRKSVARRRDARAETRHRLLEHLHHAALVVEAALRGHLPDEVEEAGGLPDDGLAAHAHIGDDAVRGRHEAAARGGLREERCGAHAARVGAYLAGELDAILALGAHLEEARGEQRQERELLEAHRLGVKAHVRVHDPGGGQRVR